MQGQLTSMKKDLSQDRVEADDQLVKRLRLEKKQVFKKKGNERQYVNQEVLSHVKAALWSLASCTVIL